MQKDFNIETKEILVKKIIDKVVELSKNEKIIGMYLNTYITDTPNGLYSYVLIHAVVNDLLYDDCQDVCEKEIAFTDKIDDIDFFVYGCRYSKYNPYMLCGVEEKYCWWLSRGTILWDPDEKLITIKKKMNRIRSVADKLKKWKVDKEEDNISPEINNRCLQKINLLK